jgi:hypothetical protein
LTTLLLGVAAIACFIIYHFVSRNPGDNTASNLKHRNKNQQFNVESQTAQLQRQNVLTAAQIARAKQIEEAEELENVLARQRKEAELAHKAIVAASKNSEVVINAATANRLDPATYNLTQLEAERERLRSQYREKEIEQDLFKARELTRLELVKQRIEARNKINALEAARKVKERLDGPNRKDDSGGKPRGLHEAGSDGGGDD